MSNKAASDHTHSYAGSPSEGGSANAAIKLKTARTLTIGSTGKTFDGSADVSWSLSEIGAAASSHTHSYLPLSGGTLTGNIKINVSNPAYSFLNSEKTKIATCKMFETGVMQLMTCDSTDGSWDSTNTAQFLLYPADAQSDIKKRALVNWDGTSYALYGTHNKPTVSDVGALALTGGTISGDLCVTGALDNKGGYYVDSIAGSSGTTGYTAIATIKVVGTYCNCPIIFVLGRRSAVNTCKIILTFANANSTDPSVATFTYEGVDFTVYLCKTDTSTYKLWVKKSEGYDSTQIIFYHLSYYNKGKITVTLTSEHSDSAPTADTMYTATAAYHTTVNANAFWLNGLSTNPAKIVSSSPSNTTMLLAY